MKRLIFTISLLGALTGLSEAQTPKELAVENRALVAKYGKSVAAVRYYVKKNVEGVEPKFRIPYKCPNCNSTHWRSSEVSAEDGIPAEFAGYVIAPDEVIVQDVMIAPEFIDRIEVSCAGETVAATEAAACPAEKALILKTDRPMSAAVPLVFTGGGEPEKPRYFYLVQEQGETVASVSGSNIAKFTHHVEAGKDVYDGKPNTLVLDKDGNPVTVAYQLKVFLGEENFTPPTAWKREPASARFDRKRAFEESLKKSILPVFVQLEAPGKENGPSRRIRFSDDGLKGNDFDTCVVLVENAAFVPLKLGPQETARLVKMEATLPDGKKVPLEFVGSYTEVGAMAVSFKDGLPAGLEPLRLDRRPILAHFGETVRVVSALNKSGTLELKGGDLPIWGFVRGKGNKILVNVDGKVLGAALSEAEERLARNDGLVISSEGLVALQCKNRKENRGSWAEQGLQGEALQAFVAVPSFDAENVPRAVEDRKRTPWLGVEVQLAGQDILREKKATAFFKSYELDSAALVTAVVSNTPAAKLGIKEGDVLVSVCYPGGREESLSIEREMFSGLDWNEIFNDPRFLEMGGAPELTPWPNAEGGVNGVLTEKFSVGAEVIIAWVSEGKRKEGRCTLELAPVHYANAPRARNRDLGLTVCDMTYEVRKYFKFEDKAPGVVVAKVKGGGTAAVAGIRPLELILEVNGEGVVSAKDFAEKTKGKKDLTFTVRRLTTTRMVPIKL